MRWISLAGVFYSDGKPTSITVIAGGRRKCPEFTLITKWPTPPPQEYIASLDRDQELCDAANHETPVRADWLEVVKKDIEIKAKDCEQYGMGRLIPVSVRTLKGGRPDNGWQVLYKWKSVSSLEIQELNSDQLSPTTLQLPPGSTYAIRAKKLATNGQISFSDTQLVLIDSRPTIVCDIPVN